MEVPHGTAYIRNQASLDRIPRSGDLAGIVDTDGQGSPAILPRTWDLLRTPQTVETVCRVLTRERQLGEVECRREVTSVFAQLLHAELIEISPDA